MGRFKRIVLMVLDGVGIGEMPDAADWGDAGRCPSWLLSLSSPPFKMEPEYPHTPILAAGRQAGSFGKAAIFPRNTTVDIGKWPDLLWRNHFDLWTVSSPILEPFQKPSGGDTARRPLGNHRKLAITQQGNQSCIPCGFRLPGGGTRTGYSTEAISNR
jgi:hypothetical protein